YVLPPSVENDDSDEEVDAVDVLRVDNFIQNSEHEYSESEDSDFNNPPIPLPPPEPPDEEFDFEINLGNEISVVRSAIVKFESIDARVKFDVFNDENDVLSYFITKNLIPIPHECKVVSENRSESTEPVNDNSSIFTTISNPFFNNDKINSDEINSHVEFNSDESTSNHHTVKGDYLDEFYGPFIPIHILEEERIRREHAD
nr:hypothetical protein [Tanacetum cinerariifolium]